MFAYPQKLIEFGFFFISLFKVQLFSRQFYIVGRFLFVCLKCFLLLSRTEINVKLPIMPHQNAGGFNPLPVNCFQLPFLSVEQAACHWWAAWVQIELYNMELAFNKLTSKEKREIKGSFCFSWVYPLRAIEKSIAFLN